MWRHRLLHSCDFTYDVVSGLVWRTRSDLQNLGTTRQRTATSNRITEGVETEVGRHTNTSSSSAGDRDHQPQIDYRFGERARITMRPQIKCARSQGTTSPQICVTFRHFNHQPIIWHRGPARGLIGTCAQM